VIIRPPHRLVPLGELFVSPAATIFSAVAAGISARRAPMMSLASAHTRDGMVEGALSTP